jgi:mono/diheme cytochrome c family protein
LGLVNAKAVQGALGSGDPFVVESAIRLSALLPEADRVALLPEFKRLAGSGELVIQRELAASLGRVPSRDALVLLKEVLVRNLEVAYVRELAISGLEGREQEFREVLGEEFRDDKFLKYLDHCLTPKTTAAAFQPPRNKAHLESFKRGEKFYIANCMACHGADGAGMEMLGPPMVKSEWVLESDQRLAAILLQGLKGPIEVAGKKYTPAAEMPGLKEAPHVSDANLADVATFVRYAWNNGRGAVKPETVTAVRQKLSDRQAVFTPEELEKEFP